MFFLLYIGGVEKLNGIFVAPHVLKAEAGFVRYLASRAACLIKNMLDSSGKKFVYHY
jgi:hypothetical protein